MDLGISGRTAIVCASSRGLGRACAESLAANGVDVVINGRDTAMLEKTTQALRGRFNVKVTPVVADVSTPHGQKALLDACPSPDILVNNNGGPPLKPYLDVTREDLLAGAIQNMVTPIELFQKVLPGMRERSFGRIVNITSTSVRMPILGLDVSSAARAGLTAFLAGPARDVARHNVTVNAVMPGMFDTDRLRGSTAKMAEMRGKPREEMAAERAASVPAKRFGRPEEVGELVAFLCSAQAGYITGQSLLIDGGLFNSVT
ncbi:MAG: SDR family oxidoreductase [Hyphomicrobiales bacterium]